MPAETAQIVRYLIRPSAESTLTLEVFKSGILSGKKHLFFFEDYQGELDYDPARVENSQVRLTIQARSVTCKDNWIKAEDRKKVLDAALNDMMAVNQYPQISFISSRIVTKLTVRGIAKPVTLEAAVKSVADVRLEIDGDAYISHKDYGLTPLSKFGGIVGTKDQMMLRFLVWAEKQP
jgi:polyisoprenoid-binding protein YceI